MKTVDCLFPQICTFENLYHAAIVAHKGKKDSTAMSHFHFHLESEVLQLRTELEQKTYQPGNYTTFTIYDPKTRMISAAPYRDRVVHHALCRVIEPIFDKTFIYDSYANRIGKGTHKAIERYQVFAKKYPYVLKCDIRKFFPSIDHQILKQAIYWKIICPDTRWLIDTIIDHSNPQEPHVLYFPGDDLFTPHQRKRGLPIGNLTSQFWANVYMNSFDHYVKETLQVKGYIRYVDDFVLFGDNRQQLRNWQQKITGFLAGLRLVPHPSKTQIYRTDRGVPFLGFQVFPHYRYVRKEKIWRYKRHLRRQVNDLTPDTAENFVSGINSWLGHIRFGQSRRLESQVFNYLCKKGLSLQYRPGGSWRLVEQQ
ncbi:MAG: RNA-directed DNA polymerase [Bacteroidia bacterium]|nr:RNA-directed DNA polymerase [Bacteroidia bacterium]